jgi:hypothetical protein
MDAGLRISHLQHRDGCSSMGQRRMNIEELE